MPTALLAIGLLLLLFRAPGSPPPEVSCTAQRGGTVTAAAVGQHVTLAVVSERGIGEATVTVGARKPARLTVRLPLKGLEHFSVSDGKTTLGLAVSSDAEHRVRRWAMHNDDAKREETPVAAGDPLWMPLRTLPDHGGFEIDIPRALYGGTDAVELQVNWVDFYRG